MVALRTVGSALLVAVMLAGCGSPAAGPASGSPEGPPDAVESGGAEPQQSSAATEAVATAEDSGATIRVVNVWAEPDGPGPTVILRVQRSDVSALLEIAPGEISDFVSIPKAQYGDSAAQVEVVASGTPMDETGISMGQVMPGDRITAIVHGEAREGAIHLRVEPVWEVGDPFYGPDWPDADSSRATLAVYAGPLQIFPQGSSTVALRTLDGDCLVEAIFGEPKEGGFGGTGATFFFLDAGTTQVMVGSQPEAECTPIEPDIGDVTIDASAGQRFGLIPWGQADQLELILLDMGVR